MMRIVSLAAGTVLPVGPESTIDIAARAGYSHVGLRPDPTSPPAGGWSALRRRADDAGLVIFDIEVVRLGFTPQSEIDALIDAAAQLGAAWLLTVSHHEDHSETTAGLQEMSEKCARVGSGIAPALEFMSFTGVKTLNDAHATALEAGAGLVIDALHLHRTGSSPAMVAELMTDPKAPPCYLQVCDTATEFVAADDLAHEARHGRLVPGAGLLPLGALIAALPAGTAIAAEVQSDSLLASLGPEHLATTCREAIQRILAHR